MEWSLKLINSHFLCTVELYCMFYVGSMKIKQNSHVLQSYSFSREGDGCDSSTTIPSLLCI